eukprot:5052166-Amphidinium_carterae.1
MCGWMLGAHSPFCASVALDFSAFAQADPTRCDLFYMSSSIHVVSLMGRVPEVDSVPRSPPQSK